MSILAKIYYYKDKPYKILHIGKAKSQGIIIKVGNLSGWDDGVPPTEEQIREGKEDLKKSNAEWIDVVIYSSTFDGGIYVREKEEFYNLFKLKE